MNHPTRFTPRSTFVALLFAAFSLAAWAQPRPAETVPSTGPTPAPGGGGPVPLMNVGGPSTPMQSPMLQGIISADEYKAYTAFQQQINEDPAIKEINAKLAKLTKEIQQLRTKANATREKLISANPEIKAIRDKIMEAMHARASKVSPAMPMPGPMPGPIKSN